MKSTLHSSLSHNTTYMNKKNRIGCLFALAFALVFPGKAPGFPTQNNSCVNCHGNPPASISLTTDVSSVTVLAGQKFTIISNWTGSGTDAQTVAKWPSLVLNNAVFTPIPVMSVAGIMPSGSLATSFIAPDSGTVVLRDVTTGSHAYAASAKSYLASRATLNVTGSTTITIKLRKDSSSRSRDL